MKFLEWVVMSKTCNPFPNQDIFIMFGKKMYSPDFITFVSKTGKTQHLTFASI